MAGRVPMPSRGAMPSSQSNMNRRTFAECLPSTRTQGQVSTAPPRWARLRWAAVRGCPRPVAGRSLRASCPSLTRMLTALRHPACAGQHTPALGAWAAPHGYRKEHRATSRGPEGRVSTNGRRPCRDGMAGCHAQHQKPEVSKRVRRLIAGHDARLAPAGGGPPSRDGQDGRARRVFSIVPAARELPGPAACRWCWRRATSCRWWSVAEARRASAAWTVEPGWSRPACPAETGCSVAGPGC